MKKIITTILLLAACLFSVSAKAKRVNNNKDLNLNGYWNENDVKLVCDQLINEIVKSPKVSGFKDSNGRVPVVVLGTIKNESSERIDTRIIAKKMQNAIFNSGIFDFVADKTEREELREEVAEQSDHASEETAKAMDNEEGADFMLMGSVNSIVQKEGRKSVRTYYVYVQLMDLESHKLIWSGDAEPVRKYFKQSAVKF